MANDLKLVWAQRGLTYTAKVQGMPIVVKRGRAQTDWFVEELFGIHAPQSQKFDEPVAAMRLAERMATTAIEAAYEELRSKEPGHGRAE